jgi:DNA-binding transcriptional LysR family regulator
VEIRQLEYVIVLGETLHFGRAAQRMHIAQSAFSTQVARLERQVGAQLFDRSGNRVRLTPAGEVYLTRARQIVSEITDASNEARILHTANLMQLRIGLFCEAAAELTPLIMDAFRAAMPGVELSFRELSMVDQVEAVAAEIVDIAFIRSPVTDNRVQLHELFAEPRYVGLPRRHELTALDQVKISDLVEQAFAVAVPEAPADWKGYWAFDDVRGEAGRVAASVTNVPESLNAIAYQGAIDTFPGSATRFLRFPGVAFRRIVDGSYSPIAVATRVGERRAQVEAFRHIAQQLAATSLHVVPEAVPMDEAPNSTPRVA